MSEFVRILAGNRYRIMEVVQIACLVGAIAILGWLMIAPGIERVNAAYNNERV